MNGSGSFEHVASPSPKKHQGPAAELWTLSQGRPALGSEVDGDRTVIGDGAMKGRARGLHLATLGATRPFRVDLRPYGGEDVIERDAETAVPPVPICRAGHFLGRELEAKGPR